MIDWLKSLPWYLLLLLGFGSGAVLGTILLRVRLKRKLAEARRKASDAAPANH